MREMAKNYIHFTHCSINEPSKYFVIWQVYLVSQASLGAVDGWGRVSIDVPFFTSCVAPARSYCTGAIIFSFRNERDLSSSAFLFISLRN